MISSTRRWLKRHRGGIAIGVGVVGAGYLAGQYILSKISETRDRMSSDRTARENLRRRFEQNQADCSFTVLALLPTAAENIIDSIPVEELTTELQQKKAQRLAKISGEINPSEISSASPSVDDGKSLTSGKEEDYVHASQTVDPSSPNSGLSPEGQKTRSRAELWNDLKINTLTRSFTLLYVLSLLTLFTRIQLNLLGRRSYLSSVISLASPPQDSGVISLEDHDDESMTYAFGNDFETNRRYLTFSWWLLHRGWKDLMEKVKAAVIEVYGQMNPREDVTPDRLSVMTLAVRKLVEGDTEEARKNARWLPYLLPPKEQENYVLQESGVLSDPNSSLTGSISLRQLLDESSDLIDSPAFTHILTLLNNEGFSTLIDQKCAIEAFRCPPETASFSNETPIPKSKLATILAVISRQAHNIGNGTNPPNEYLVAMEQGVRQLEAFAAVVYSSNFDLKVSSSGPGSIAPENNGSSAGSTTPPSKDNAPLGGEASIIEFTDSSVSLTAESPDNTTADFEKIWNKSAGGQN